MSHHRHDADPAPELDLPSFDVRTIPFSRRGAWIDLSPVTGLHRTADDIHLVSHTTGMHPIVSIVPTREGARLETTWDADPASLRWIHAGQVVATAVFENDSTVRIRGRGADLTLAEAADELTPFTGSYLFRDPVDQSVVLTSYETGRRYRFSALRGLITVVGDQALGQSRRSVTITGDESGAWEIAIQEFTSAGAAHDGSRDFDSLVTAAGREFGAYAAALAPARSTTSPDAVIPDAVARAAYVLWSATVAPSGFIERETVLMSKHWMDKVWSWDHAFNALALAPGHPDAALDQFLAPFDHQDAAGCLPDSITQSEVLYNFVKPPIHGWALRRLRERLPRPLAPAELATIYERLERWTAFWLDHRRVPGSALPHYQHGNDSGWDNATTFDLDRVIESPDLAAFLLIQLDTLADLADELGRDGTRWRDEHRRLRTALDDELRDDKGFVARAAASGRRAPGTSLLTLLPIVLGEELAPADAEHLRERLGAHLTDWGLATQRVDTPEYDSDGYWRGPIWAPSTMLIENGLRRAGFTDLADTVSARFRRLCEQSGFAENFDALTGAGLRDRAYTWTASVYLCFVRDAAGRE
ncbi:amylo-alpha-1,6-glucosidase [Microbacterium arborescens]